MQEAGLPKELADAKAGNEPALAAIIARYMPLVQRLAHRVACPGLEYEDAVQEGIIGLFSAIEHYDPAKEAAFATYAGICVRNAVYTAQKVASRKKHAPLNQSVPLSEWQSTPGPEEQAIASEAVSQTLAKARGQLSSLEKAVLGLTLDGYGQAEVARRLGRPVKSVENALRRLRAKLR